LLLSKLAFSSSVSLVLAVESDLMSHDITDERSKFERLLFDEFGEFVMSPLLLYMYEVFIMPPEYCLGKNSFGVFKIILGFY
jgi:hypothetical protein